MADLSSLGVKFGYAVETTAGTKPSAFTQIERCKSIGAIELSQEQIDTSCLEDLISQYTKGRQDTGGEWQVTFHSGAIAELTAMMTAYAGLTGGKQMWFEVYIPTMSDAFFVIAQPGTKIPLPDIADNSVLEFPISLTIVEYKGLDTAVVPA